MDSEISPAKEETTELNSAVKDYESHKDKSTYNAKNILVADSIGTQNNFFSQEELKLKDILITPDNKYFSEICWRRTKISYNTDDLNRSLSSLLDKQIIFISSDKYASMRALAYYISEEKKLDINTKCEILFEKDNEKKYFGFNDLLKKFNDEKNMFILADLSQYLVINGQKKFLESLTVQLHTDNLKKLRENKIYFVILISQRAVREMFNEYEQYFHIWDIDGAIDSGIITPDPHIFFENLNQIEKILVYGGTYFNGLPFRSFNCVIDSLLSKQENDLTIAFKQYRNFKKGAELITHLLDKPLKDIWDSNKNRLFKSSYLIGKEEGGMLIVDFAYSDLRDNLLKYFKEKEHFFWQEQLDIVEENNLVFTGDERLALKVIDLLMYAIDDDPSYYNENWFWNQAIKIIMYQYADIEIPDSGDSPEKNLFHILQVLDSREWNANRYYDRLAQILDIMQPKQKEVVNKTLEKIANNDYNILLKLIKRIDNDKTDKINWIRIVLDNATQSETRLNAYQWFVDVIAKNDIKRTWSTIEAWINEGGDDDNAPFSYYTARYFIIHFFIKETFSFPLADYGKWPSSYSLFLNYEENKKECHEHLIYVLSQFFHKDTANYFVEEENTDLEEKTDTNVIVFTCDLLVLEDGNNSQTFRIVKEFVKGRLEYQKNSCSYQTLLADIIEGWYHIITGFEQEHNKEKEDLIDFILKTFLAEATANSAYSGRIINRWEKKPGFYKELIAYLKLYSQQHADTLSNADQKALKKYGEVLYKRKNNLETFLQQLNTHLTTATL